jgi:hypothetical protein
MSTIVLPRSMSQRSRPTSELVLSVWAILAITALYLFVVLRLGIPKASGLFGHTFGVLGFTLMLTTETLYSIRKRQRTKAWGRMSDWLRFHIFTGLVGPYMVFLHSAWTFKGLAGVTLLLTGIIVVSGFIGRYLYTAVPRTADGVVLEAGEIQAQLAAAEAQLRERMETVASHGRSRRRGAPPRSISLLVRAGSDARTQSAEIRALLKRRRQLEHQVASLATARRLLALWHSIHVPLGISLFAAAFMHAAAAIYYATLLR